MAGWGMDDMAAALNTTRKDVTPTESTPDVRKNPQEAGWVAKQSYDYDTYNKSSKELMEVGAAGSGLESRAWASNAARYEWNDEYGDIVPRFEELEKQLFGLEFRPSKGIDFSKVQEISVIQEGSVRINPVRHFRDAGLHPVMLKNVELARYEAPTPVQAYCLPAILKGHDVVACAQTGSGKTAAFLVPTLSKLMGKAKKLAAWRPNPATYREGVDAPVRAEPLLLVVCPSRELATQIFDESRRFCYRSMLRPCVVYGGGPVVEQQIQLCRGCDVLIATPGRLCDFIDRPHILSLRRLKYMVIDEADEMLNANWEAELNKIMSGGDQEVGNITYMMFSATFPKAARNLATQHLAHDHVRIRVGRSGSTHSGIKQTVVYVEPALKRKALIDLIYANPPARTIIFVNTKRAADELDDYLFNLDLPCTSIHSDRTQREREDALRAFRTGVCPILIATGVSARGIDVPNVLHIINYDLPSTQHGGIEEYVHRIGRTGRIGNLGLATAFYNERDSDIAEVLTKMLLETKQDVPDFLQHFIPEDYQEGNVLKFEVDSDEEDDRTAIFSGDGGIVAVAGIDNGGNAGRDASTQPTTTPAAATAAWNAFEGSQPEIRTSGPKTTVAPNVVEAVPAVRTSTTGGGWSEPEPVAPAVASVRKVAPTITAAKTNPATKVVPVAAASASGWGVPIDDGWGSGGGESSW